jgi:hypothetical protein
MARSLDYRVQVLQERLKLIDVAKQRYLWLIDPDNAKISRPSGCAQPK